MPAVSLRGGPLVELIRDGIRRDTAALAKAGTVPTLAIVDATGDEASACYAKMKMLWAGRLGIRTSLHNLDPRTTSQEAFLRLLNSLGRDPSVHGVFIERPLPASLNAADWASCVPPLKDVEGEHPTNMGKLFLGLSSGPSSFVPTTALACIELLKYYNFPLEGRHAVVVGRSVTVGKPLAWLLLNANATVTICHSRTPDLGSFTRLGDIVIMATGQPRLLKGEMVRPGAIVLDVGVNYLPDGSVTGDVDFASVSEVASSLTPSTGGLGPVTTALLLQNVVKAARAAH